MVEDGEHSGKMGVWFKRITNKKMSAVSEEWELKDTFDQRFLDFEYYWLGKGTDAVAVAWEQFRGFQNKTPHSFCL